MIYTALDDFYLTAEQLQASPSFTDGVAPPLEAQLRRYGCDVISEAVVLLKLPQGVACTAQVLLHRFYCKSSLMKFDVKVMAIALFWLAAKLEEVIEIDSESKLKLRDVLSVFYRVIRRRDGKSLEPLDPYSNQYSALKLQVVSAERHALRAFGFVVHVEHPHRFVLTFGQLLGLDREVLQEGWNIANDSLRAPLCVRYRAEVVACGVLFLAARRKQVPMPETPPWWELFNVSRQQLGDVCSALTDLYLQPKAEYVALGRDYTSRGEAGAASPVQIGAAGNTEEAQPGNSLLGARQPIEPVAVPVAASIGAEASTQKAVNNNNPPAGNISSRQGAPHQEGRRRESDRSRSGSQRRRRSRSRDRDRNTSQRTRSRSRNRSPRRRRDSRQRRRSRSRVGGGSRRRHRDSSSDRRYR